MEKVSKKHKHNIFSLLIIILLKILVHPTRCNTINKLYHVLVRQVFQIFLARWCSYLTNMFGM